MDGSLRDSDTPNLMMNEGHPRSNSDGFSSQLGDFTSPPSLSESILLENNDSFSPYINDEPYQPNNNPSQDGDTDFIKVTKISYSYFHNENKVNYLYACLIK